MHRRGGIEIWHVGPPGEREHGGGFLPGLSAVAFPLSASFVPDLFPEILDLPLLPAASCSLALHLQVPHSVPTGKLPLLLSKQLARSHILGWIRPRGLLATNLGNLESGLSQRNHFRPCS